MKNILLIATGGTIASKSHGNGLTPTFDAEQLLSFLPEIKALCNIKGISIMSIDSTNMTPKLMSDIARAIYDHYEKYDGFVVSHGTDTLAYTASMLTYMLPGIQKTVVVVGSQTAIDYQYTDAKQNISDAIRFAMEGVGGVFVAFDGKIMLGTRITKIKTKSMDAFSSLNFPIIAIIKFGKITYNSNVCHSPILNQDLQKPFEFKPDFSDAVYLVKIFPGMRSDIFDYIKENYKGAVIEGYGIGGIPTKPINLTKKIGELAKAGVAVVITTQCLEEGIDLDVYEVGKELKKENVIYGGDMNREAIIMKLMWALGNLKTFKEIKAFMEKPIFGDLTITLREDTF